MVPEVKKEAVRRLSYIQGHLEGIKRMVEEERYCVEILRQLFALRRAIEEVSIKVLDGHLRTCVIQGIRDARAEEVVDELKDLFSLAVR